MILMEKKEINLPLVSIVIITLNRIKNLEKCLNSILNLVYPLSKLDIIVVDGGSVDGTQEMVSRHFPNVNFILEKRRGVAIARNTGWRHSKGKFVAYTDDDCIVDPYWIRRLVASLESSNAKGAGGPVVYLHPEAIPKYYGGTPFGTLDLGGRKRSLKEGENLITANMLIATEVFKEIRFWESLIYNDSEDAEFCRAVLEAGYILLYVPDATIYHNIDLKRINLGYLLKRAFFSGITSYIIERKRKRNITLIPRYFRFFLGGCICFFYRRTIESIYWSAKSFVAFLASVLLIALWN
jgi:GT2 family glycosyltransferase